MARYSLARATRLRQIKIALNISRMLQKNLLDVTKDDIDELAYKVVTHMEVTKDMKLIPVMTTKKF